VIRLVCLGRRVKYGYRGLFFALVAKKLDDIIGVELIMHDYWYNFIFLLVVIFAVFVDMSVIQLVKTVLQVQVLLIIRCFIESVLV
jgi:hypothetical protein